MAIRGQSGWLSTPRRDRARVRRPPSKSPCLHQGQLQPHPTSLLRRRRHTRRIPARRRPCGTSSRTNPVARDPCRRPSGSQQDVTGSPPPRHLRDRPPRPLTRRRIYPVGSPALPRRGEPVPADLGSTPITAAQPPAASGRTSRRWPSGAGAGSRRLRGRFGRAARRSATVRRVARSDRGTDRSRSVAKPGQAALEAR